MSEAAINVKIIIRGVGAMLRNIIRVWVAAKRFDDVCNRLGCKDVDEDLIRCPTCKTKLINNVCPEVFCPSHNG